MTHVGLEPGWSCEAPVNLNPIFIVEVFVAFVIAVTLHEAAHAGMAALLGDSTAVSKGRFSLRPARQLSGIGTIIAIAFSVSGIPGGLGWGKPVDVDAKRLRPGPNVGLVLVSLAGPLLNLVLGLGVALALAHLPGMGRLDAGFSRCLGDGGAALERCLSASANTSAVALRAEQFAYAFAVTNLTLALINIIPLHPLDGYKVLYALLPSRQAISLRNAEPYMELILLIVLFAVPVLLSYMRISFSPGEVLIAYAYQIADGIAQGVTFLYRAL